MSKYRPEPHHAKDDERHMPDTERPQWEQHNLDEALARQAQQDSAGGTHSPVTGPAPYGDDAINALVRRAVLAERERCARLASSWPVEPGIRDALGGISDRDRSVAQLVIERIVTLIRSDQEPR
jgi:hypothetical protein